MNREPASWTPPSPATLAWRRQWAQSQPDPALAQHHGLASAAQYAWQSGRDAAAVSALLFDTRPIDVVSAFMADTWAMLAECRHGSDPNRWLNELTDEHVWLRTSAGTDPKSLAGRHQILQLAVADDRRRRTAVSDRRWSVDEVDEADSLVWRQGLIETMARVTTERRALRAAVPAAQRLTPSPSTLHAAIVVGERRVKEFAVAFWANSTLPDALAIALAPDLLMGDSPTAELPAGVVMIVPRPVTALRLVK